jgi:hypothetical protein
VRKQAGAWVCIACGAVVDVASNQPVLTPGVGVSVPVPTWQDQLWFGIPVRGWLVFGASAIIAWLVMQLVNFVNWIVHMLGTLCHEMGHAAAALLVGRPALPAFDFGAGGGITIIGERRWWLLAIYGFALFIMAREWRTQPKRLWFLAGVTLTITLFILTGWDMALFVWAGFGGQLLAVIIFLFRGLTGVAEIQPGERWLYAVIGWGLFGHAFAMCWMLLFDPAFQHFYLIGKRGIDNDFVRLAQEHWGISLHGVAWFNISLATLSPVLAVLASRWWLGRRHA